MVYNPEVVATTIAERDPSESRANVTGNTQVTGRTLYYTVEQH